MATTAPTGEPNTPVAGSFLTALGDLLAVRAAGVETGGAYALFEARTPPGGGMPSHLQRYEDEAFLVLEGTFAVRAGARTTELGPGGYLFVPRGTPHAYTNVGTGTGRLLVIVSPGGIHEQFLAEAGALASPDGERIATLGEKYGVELLAVPDG
jgi:quercetin dioxygenase-like cupin family protein